MKLPWLLFLLIRTTAIAQETSEAPKMESMGRNVPQTADQLAATEGTHESSASDNTKASFCRSSMPMSMFMDGFHSSLDRAQDCLSYFVRNWTLDDRSKFIGAMLYSFLLAMIMEALSAVRVSMQRQARHAGSCLQQRPRLRATLLTAVYTAQGLLGYLIMLLTMSFSMELLASVLVGLMVGNVLFFKADLGEDNEARERPLRRRRRRPDGAGDLDVPLLSPDEER